MGAGSFVRSAVVEVLAHSGHGHTPEASGGLSVAWIAAGIILVALVVGAGLVLLWRYRG